MYQRASIYSMHKLHLHLQSDKGGVHHWVTKGSLANHKGESLQAATTVAKKRSTALDENTA